MNSDDAVRAVIDVLEELRVPYMLVGSLSSNFYGVVRSTKDADFVLRIDADATDEMLRRLGQWFVIDPPMRFENVTGKPMHVMQCRASEFRIELFVMGEDPFDQERFSRRVRVRDASHQREVWLPTAEDVIVNKMRWWTPWRQKDAEDVVQVIAVQADRLDWPYIYKWTDVHRTTAKLNGLRGHVAKMSGEEGIT